MPPYFPELPDGNWPYSIRRAHERLESAYQRILRILAQEDSDPARVRDQLRHMESTYTPLLEAMERSGQLPSAWIEQAAEVLLNTIPQLNQACAVAEERWDRSASHT